MSFNRKKLIALVAVAAMSVNILAPLTVSAQEVQPTSVVTLGQNSTQINAPFNEGDSRDIQILATSDTHGRFVAYDYAINAENKAGSLAQVATAVKKLREQNPNNTIVVDAGDTIQDNSSALFLNDPVQPMISAMNAIGYDTWTLGNHEFNYGVPVLQKLMNQFKSNDNSKDSILAGNVYEKDGVTRLGAPYKIITTKDGVRVAILGMVTPNIVRWDATNLEGYKVTDPLVETKAAIKDIKDNNKADIIIGVNHMGEENEYDIPNSGIKDIAAACPEIDAFVAAHFHVRIDGDYAYKGQIYKPAKDGKFYDANQKDITAEVKGSGAVIVEPDKWADMVSKINIKVTKKDGKFVIANRATDITSTGVTMTSKQLVDGKSTTVVNYDEDASLKAALAEQDTKAKNDAIVPIGKLEGGNLALPNEINGIAQDKIAPNAVIDLINKAQMYYGEKLIGEKFPNEKVDVAAAAVFRNDADIQPGTIKKM